MTIRTKWPRLLVVGEPVTEEQAEEILVRTDAWVYTVNDDLWESQVRALAAEFGAPTNPGWRAPADQQMAYWNALDEWTGRLGVLDLHYLRNERIASAWIGGSHGWCDWDGTIGCCTWNIGKWPSDGEVTDDWATIAEAFPYLNLTAQVVEDEGDGELAGQWTVRSGQVQYDPQPTERICPADDLDKERILRRLPPGGERGCTIDRLRQALARVSEGATHG